MSIATSSLKRRGPQKWRLLGLSSLMLLPLGCAGANASRADAGRADDTAGIDDVPTGSEAAAALADVGPDSGAGPLADVGGLDPIGGVDGPAAEAQPDVVPIFPDASVGRDSPGVSQDSAGAKTIRVYVAGESIEQWNKFDATPFTATGTLVSSTDGAAEYGWMTPFADRLRLRDSGLTVQWVGSLTWMSFQDRPYAGTYPSASAPATSAQAGTTVRAWLDAHKSELTNKTYCYDVALATRGGNDANSYVDESTYKTRLRELLLALGAGSSCRTHPVIYVTGHMPDQGAGRLAWEQHNTQPTMVADWVSQLRTVYVTWTKAVVDTVAAEDPTMIVRFVDMFTPFMQNQPTPAFPSPSWTFSTGTVVGPDLDKIHQDGYHPKRLASIYAGEIVANAVDPGTIRSVR